MVVDVIGVSICLRPSIFALRGSSAFKELKSRACVLQKHVKLEMVYPCDERIQLCLKMWDTKCYMGKLVYHIPFDCNFHARNLGEHRGMLGFQILGPGVGISHVNDQLFQGVSPNPGETGRFKKKSIKNTTDLGGNIQCYLQ